MSLRKISTIFRKDLREVIRDSRVLVALIVPFGIGIFYNLSFNDNATTVNATIAYTAAGQTKLPDAIRSVVPDTVNLRIREVASEADVRKSLDNDDADLGLVIPAGFDEALDRGERPVLTVLHPPSSSVESDYLSATIEPALRSMAGQQLPATIDFQSIPTTTENKSVLDVVGQRVWAVFGSIVLMICMISMLAIPVMLTEETEKKTLDALVLIASYADVIVAKALIGVFFVAVMVPLLLRITDLSPVHRPLFIATVALLSVTLIGFGLLLAGLFKSANQLNTWSGVLLTPLVAPAFIVGLPAPDLLQKIVTAFPTGSGMKLLLASASHETLFTGKAFSFAIIAAWGVVAYGLLYWQLSRRQA